MSVEILRNVKDGSTREVETNSDEYVELINEMYDHEGSARPKWEITGRHHMQRLDDGAAQEADYGYEDKPIPAVVANLEEIGPEQHPERQPTPGEVDSGWEGHDAKMASINAGLASMNAVGHVADRPVEPLEKTAPEDRLESGESKVGRASRSSSRKSNSTKSSDKQTTAAAGSSSGSGSGSGSSGSGSTGSSGS